MFYNDNSETLVQVAPRGGSCLIPGDTLVKIDGSLDNVIELKALLVAQGSGL